MEQRPFRKLVVGVHDQEISRIYRNRRFIAVFTKAWHLAILYVS
jgi:hypothetical protein